MFYLLDIIIETMTLVEKDKELSGPGKKEKALIIIKDLVTQQWGQEVWLKYQDLIPHLIDFICMLSKNEIVLDINKKLKHKCRQCFF